MESANRDEAKRCLEKAKVAFSHGGKKEAERLLLKSIKLCHSSEAEEFLTTVRTRLAESPPVQGGAEKPGSDEQAEVHQEKTSTAEYTDEQKEAVQRVLKYKDYYDILGVTREASSENLKKQYKRLALTLHPDKNRAPQSDEAFKAVGNAYSILSDGSRRNQYDRFGEDGLHGTHINAEADVSPDDLFRMFFGDNFFFEDERFMYGRGGGVFMYNQRPRRTRFTHRHHRQEQSQFLHFCQILPLIIILVVSLSSSALQSYFAIPAPFSLHRSREYSMQRQTEKHRIPYYVKGNFKDEFGSKIKAIEREVVEQYVWNLRVQCNDERYRGIVGQSCKKLKKLQSSLRTT